MITEPRSPEPPKPSGVELGLELQEDIAFAEGLKLEEQAEKDTLAVSESADAIVAKAKARGSELTMDENERLKQVKTEKPKGAFRRFKDWVTGNTKSASGEITTDAKLAGAEAAVAAVAATIGEKENVTPADAKKEKKPELKIDVPSEVLVLSGNDPKQLLRQLGGVWDRLRVREDARWTDKDAKLYKKLIKAGDESGLTEDERAYYHARDPVPTDAEYQEMKSGKRGWTMNGTWRAVREIYSGVFRAPESAAATAPRAGASEPAEGGAAALAAGLVGLAAAAEAFAKDTGEVGTGEAPDYDEVTVTEGETAPDAETVERAQKLVERHIASNKTELPNFIEKVRQAINAPGYGTDPKSESLPEKYRVQLELLNAALAGRADGYVKLLGENKLMTSEEADAIVATGKSRGVLESDIEFTNALLSFAIEEEKRVTAKAKGPEKKDIEAIARRFDELAERLAAARPDAVIQDATARLSPEEKVRIMNSIDAVTGDPKSLFYFPFIYGPGGYTMLRLKGEGDPVNQLLKEAFNRPSREGGEQSVTVIESKSVPGTFRLSIAFVVPESAHSRAWSLQAEVASTSKSYLDALAKNLSDHPDDVPHFVRGLFSNYSGDGIVSYEPIYSRQEKARAASAPKPPEPPPALAPDVVTTVDVAPAMSESEQALNLISEVNDTLGKETLNIASASAVVEHLAELRKKLDEFTTKYKTPKERKIAARGYRDAIKNILKPKGKTK